MQILVRSKKYDERPHIEWMAEVLSKTATEWVTFARPGTPATHYTRKLEFSLSSNLLGVFPTGAWYNAFLDFDATGKLFHVYCNVALPPVEVDGRLEWVDLDLDVIWKPESGVRLDDEDEFVEHAAAFGYPPEVVQGARAAADWLLERARRGEAPFCFATLDEALDYYGCSIGQQ